MTEKRFKEIISTQKVIDTQTGKEYDCLLDNDLFELINELAEENTRLKKELAIYRKVVSCSNCKYHNYDWYDDGDEFEVCDKGNDVTEWICEEWEEL